METITGLWQKSRTWVGSDEEYFELTPDYQRIKGNIEYLRELFIYLNKTTFEIIEMPIYTEYDIPTADFFNNLVENIKTLHFNSYTKNIVISTMRSYNENDDVPNFRDLNTIEENLMLLYLGNAGVVNVKQKANYAGVGVLAIF